MNKEQIKSKMQSIEESIKKETERLNALRLEMDKPEKPTLEEMCRYKDMYFIGSSSGTIMRDGCGYEKFNTYLSRERAEKEKLRIKLSVIADYFNGGLFEPKSDEECFILTSYSNGAIIATSGFMSRYGIIHFRKLEHAKLAKSYFTNDELIKMLR